MTDIVFTHDPYSGFFAVYIDGNLEEEMDYSPQEEDLFELILEKIPDVTFNSISKHQLTEKIVGFDYVEYDSYWPQNLEDLPVCTIEGCCVFTSEIN